MTRESILDSCADLVNERRHLSFSMQEIAKGAGVSLRTLYNHYPTREELLDALVERLGQRMDEMGAVTVDDLESLMDVPHAARVNFRIFGELGGASEAVAQMPVTDAHRSVDRNERTELFIAMARDVLPGDQSAARDLGLVVRHLASHRSWFALTRDYGLTSAEAGDAVARAVDVLVRSSGANSTGGRSHDGT